MNKKDLLKIVAKVKLPMTNQDMSRVLSTTIDGNIFILNPSDLSKAEIEKVEKYVKEHKNISIVQFEKELNEFDNTRFVALCSMLFEGNTYGGTFRSDKEVKLSTAYKSLVEKEKRVKEQQLNEKTEGKDNKEVAKEEKSNEIEKTEGKDNKEVKLEEGKANSKEEDETKKADNKDNKEEVAKEEKSNGKKEDSKQK